MMQPPTASAPMNSAIRFCSQCGHAVEWRTPAGDHLPRHVCPNCATVHYLNPKAIVGVIPEAGDGRVLLCRRSIEPIAACVTPTPSRP